MKVSETEAGSTAGPRVLFVKVTRGLGGSSSVLVRMVPNLLKLGVDASVLVYRNSDRVNTLAAVGVPIYEIGIQGPIPPPLVSILGAPVPTPVFFRIARHSVRFIRQARPDVVYFNSPRYGLLPVFAAAKALGCRTVCYYRETLDLLKAEKLAMRHIDRVIALSDAARLHFEQQGVDPNRLRRVYDALDYAAIKRRTANIPRVESDKFRIAIIGALIPRKGHRYLLEAIGRLLPEIPHLHVSCIGTGVDEEPLRIMARELGIEHSVAFTGFSNEVPVLLKNMDLCVAPSLAEGLVPQVALEALAVGTPVIASDLVGTREAIHDGKAGIDVPRKDVEAVATAILTMARTPIFAPKLGVYGQEQFKAGRFSPQSEAMAVRDVMTEVMN